MTRSIKQISGDIVTHMQAESRDVVTMRWSKFYAFCERDRIKESFIDALIAQLKMESILFVRGHAVVVFVKDFDFSPIR